jgi:hypothetical protein
MVAVQTSFAANIVINSLDGPGEGFNDTTSTAPVGGNPGTTLGEQRLNVFQRAADIWGRAIESSVTIVVDAALDPLSCNASSATLGAAGAIIVVRDFPNAPQANTWYHSALANALAGEDLATDSSDISATFNSAIDNNNNCLAGLNWYLGYDTNPGAGISLLDVLLHEFAHGLGFSGFVDLSTGTLLQRLPDVFSLATYDNSIGRSWDRMNNNQRRNSARNNGNVVWNGAQVRSRAGDTLTAGQDGAGNVRLYAPDQLQVGSSIYHFDTVVTPNVLMEPRLSSGLGGRLDLTDELMLDIGWVRLDSDGDGLSDSDELNELGTDPTDLDSDDDGLTDGASVVPVASYPGGTDANNDGIVEGEADSGTDPNDPDSDNDGIRDGAEVAGGTNPNDAAPTISILQPSAGSDFSIGEIIRLSGSAADPEDGLLSNSIQWASNRDGSLGTGASVDVSLSVQAHVITATVTDSQGAAASASISITVAGIYGDIDADGNVDIADLVLLERALANLGVLTPTERQRADLYPAGGDDSLDVRDLLLMRQLLQED